MLGLWKQRKGEGLTFPKTGDESPENEKNDDSEDPKESVDNEPNESVDVDPTASSSQAKKSKKKKQTTQTVASPTLNAEEPRSILANVMSEILQGREPSEPTTTSVPEPASGSKRKNSSSSSKPRRKSKADVQAAQLQALNASGIEQGEAGVVVSENGEVFVPPIQPLEEVIAPVVVDMKFERLHWKIVPASTSRKSNMLLWKYFRVYEASNKCTDTIICTMCYERKRHLIGSYPRQWEVRIGDSKSTSHLAQHLKHQHREEYQEYVQAREFYGKNGYHRNKGDSQVSFDEEGQGSSSAPLHGSSSSNLFDQSMDRSFDDSMITFDHGGDELSSSNHRVEDRLLRHYLHWAIEDCQPLQACQSANFTSMWKVITRRDVNFDLSTLTNAIQQEVQDAKRFLHTVFSSCPLAFCVNSWQDYDGMMYLIISVVFIAPEWDYVSIRLQCKSFRDLLSEQQSARSMIARLLQEYKIPSQHVTAILYADQVCKINEDDENIPTVLQTVPEQNCLAIDIDHLFHEIVMKCQIESALRLVTISCVPYYPSTITWCNLLYHLQIILQTDSDDNDVEDTNPNSSSYRVLLQSISTEDLEMLRLVSLCAEPWLQLLDKLMSEGKIVPVISISVGLGLLEDLHWQLQELTNQDVANEEFMEWYKMKVTTLIESQSKLFTSHDEDEQFEWQTMLQIAEILDPTISASTFISLQNTWDEVESRLTAIAKAKHASTAAALAAANSNTSSSSNKENPTGSATKKRKAEDTASTENVESTANTNGNQDATNTASSSSSSSETPSNSKRKVDESNDAVTMDAFIPEIEDAPRAAVDDGNGNSASETTAAEEPVASEPVIETVSQPPPQPAYRISTPANEFTNIMVLRELSYYRQRFYAHSFVSADEDDSMDLSNDNESSSKRLRRSSTESRNNRSSNASDSFKNLAYNFNREPPKSAIAFWKDWEVRMPLLATLARKMLCVPLISLVHTLHSSYQLGQNAFARNNPQVMSDMMLLHDVWTQLHDQSSLRAKVRFSTITTTTPVAAPTPAAVVVIEEETRVTPESEVTIENNVTVDAAVSAEVPTAESSVPSTVAEVAHSSTESFTSGIIISPEELS